MRANRLFPAVLASVALATALQAGDSAFDRVVDGLEHHYHTRPMGTGFLGFLASCFTPPGVSGFRMAIFDEVRQASAANLEAVVRGAVGEATPMVQVRTRGGEHSFSYLTGRRERHELLVVNVQPREAVVLTMHVDAAQLQKWMNDPSGMVHETRHGHS